ncbi:MAG: 4Fe-4S single cluster domain-containing protein [Candidatus Gracilibacteria bacterium]
MQPEFKNLTYPESSLSVAAVFPSVKTHGPGNRFSLWLQGCLQRCDGCINQHMQGLEGGNLMNQQELLEQIRSARDGIWRVRGITLHGGEPMLQASALAPVLEQLHDESPEFNVLLFTGYELAFLREQNSAAINRLLACVDTAIDGQFIAAQQDNELIRGSTNQQIIHLTDTLRNADFSRKGVETILRLGANLTVAESGVPIN